jgi:hypothetical protein
VIDVEIVVRRGTLIIPCTDYEAVFGRAGAVVLLREGADLLLVPVHHAAIGGQLVKLRNAAGDRAIDALELFRAHELDGEAELHVRAQWSPERGALYVRGLFEAQTSLTVLAAVEPQT